MNLSELVKKLDLTPVTSSFEDKPVSGCYIGDLLSWVMGRAQAGDIWITIMNNINIVAVAALTDCAAILLCESVSVSQEIVSKAEAEGIAIFSSDKTAFELARLLGGEL